MESTRVENLPPPPGVISSIKAGFDTIAAHLTAILLPIGLDLFLWLGPRLHIDSLFDSIKADVMNLWRSGGVPAADVTQMMEWYEASIPSINLFWLLRTLPIGISSLLLPHDHLQTPLGTPSVLQVGAFDLLGWIFILTLFGWVGGGVYFRSVAWLATANENDRPVSLSRAVSQTILLSILWSILCLMIGIPFSLVLVILMQLNEFIANLAILLISLASMWVIVPVFFWPHGVFLRKQNFLMSIISSIQMARFTLPTSSMFILTVFLLSIGLNYVWNIPPEDSWMTLIGILGHAFVTTALLAGSFIYYRDMHNWLQKVLERIKSNTLKQA